MLKKINQRGWRYSIAILFNRIVPVCLFRCRRFVIFELDPQRVDHPTTMLNSQNATFVSTTASATPATSIQIRWCVNETEYQAVEGLTCFHRPSDLQQPTTVGQFKAVQAKVDDQLAAGFWAAANHFDESELGIRIMLEPQQSWLFAALVAKHFRRVGIYSKVLEFILPELMAAGTSQFLIAVNPDNLASNRIHSRLSKTKSGTVLAIRCLKTTFCVATGKIETDKTWSWNSHQNPIEIKIR